MKDSNDKSVSIKGDIEDIAGDEEISDDYGLTSNNQIWLNSQQPEQLILDTQIVGRSPRSKQPINAVQNYKQNYQQSQQYPSTLQTPQVLSPEDGKVLTLGSEETGRTLSRNRRNFPLSKSTVKTNSMNSHSSLFHSKYDHGEENYAVPVAEFPTKEKLQNIQSQAEGVIKQTNAKDRILFNEEEEELYLGYLEQDQQINQTNQRQEDKRQQEQEYFGINQNPQNNLNKRQQQQQQQQQNELQSSQELESNDHKRKQYPDIEMRMITNEQGAEDQEDDYNNNEFHMFDYQNENNQINSMFYGQPLETNHEITQTATGQHEQKILEKEEHYSQQLSQPPQNKTKNHNKFQPSSFDSNESTRPLHNELHDSTGKLKHGVISVGFESEEINSSNQSIEDTMHNNLMGLENTKPPSLRNINTNNNHFQEHLNTINEQLDQNEEQYNNEYINSPHHSTNLTIHSEVYEKKKVSDYLFCEREIFSSNDWSKSYVTCKNQELVLIKVLDRKKVTEQTQEQMKNEFKQITHTQIKKSDDDYQKELVNNHPNDHFNFDNFDQQQQEESYNQNQLAYAVTLVDFFWTNQYIYIVQEYLHQQSLYSMLLHTNKMKVSDSVAVQLLSKIVAALDQITNTPHTNFNLKITNIFFDGQNIRFNDFQESYLTAKQEIIVFKSDNNNNSNNKGSLSDLKMKNHLLFKRRENIILNPNVKQLGLIYLQLICGVDAVSQATQDAQSFQKYLHSQGVLRQVSDFLLKCIYIETATLGDIRTYIQKSLHRNKKANANSSPIRFRNQIGSSNNSNQRRISEAQQISGIKNTLIMQQSSYSPMHQGKQKMMQSPEMLTSIPVFNKKSDSISIDMENENESKEGGERVFELFDNASQHEKGKTKETTFLKSYSYKQSLMSFDLKITHLKLTKYQLKDESVTNSYEFETSHSIPIFHVSKEEKIYGRRKTLGVSLNYNPKYTWEFISEIDNLPYFDLPEEDLENNQLDGQNEHYDEPTRYLLEGYQRLFRQRFHMMRCRDKNSMKNYTLKCITIEDDQEFTDVLREIAIYKYIDQNLHKGITIQRNTKGYAEIQSCLSADQEEEIPDIAHRVAEGYLEELYKQADKEVLKQLEGGIHRCIDSYIIHRGVNGMTFVIVMEDIDYTLKDFIIKNSSIMTESVNIQSQVVDLVRVIAKQIKRLKRIGIHHSNITPENILFQRQKTSKSSCFSRIVLSNFEAALISKPEEIRRELSTAFAKTQPSCYKYKAPEVRRILEACMQEKEQVDFDPTKSDIFSLGICALELQLHKIINDAVLVNTIEEIEQDTVCGDLVLGMVHFSESGRFSENDIFQYLKEQTSFHQYNDEHLSPPSSPMLFKGRAQTSRRITQKQILNLSKFRRSTTLKLLPSSKLQKMQSENYSMDIISQDQEEIVKPSQRENIDVFLYSPIQLTTIGEIPGDMQLLYQSKCARKMFLFEECDPIFDRLEQKYLKSKQKLGDQQSLEVKLLEELGNYRRDTFHLVTGMDYYQRAFTLQQRNFPEERLTAGKLQLKIAGLQLISDEGSKNSNQISTLLKSALDNYKEIYHNSSPKIVPILIAIGDELASKGFIMDALHLYQESMIITNPLGYSGPHGLRLLDKLGWAFFQSSDYQNALRFFMKSVSVKEKVLTGKYLILAESYNNLGECYRISNEPNKAIYYYESALAVTQIDKDQKSQVQFKATNEPIENHIGLLELQAQVYNNLGLIYKANVKYDKAIRLFNESLKIRTQQFGQASLEAAECQYNIAVIYAEQNKHTEAMELYDLVIQQFKVSKELDNVIYADCLQNKGISLYLINDYAKALSLINEAITIKKKKNPNSLSVGISIMNLALVYHKQGQYKKALQLYEDSLKIFVKKLKQDHPYIAIIQENMKQTQRFAR